MINTKTLENAAIEAINTYNDDRTEANKSSMIDALQACDEAKGFGTCIDSGDPLPKAEEVTTDLIQVADRAHTGDAYEAQFEDCTKVLNPDHGYHLTFTTEAGSVYHHEHTFPFGFGMHSGVLAQDEAEALSRAEALLARVRAAGDINLDHWHFARTVYGSSDWDDGIEMSLPAGRW